MEIIKKITVKLTPDDLKEIITDYLNNKGMEVKDINFIVSGTNDPIDGYNYIYDLENVTCEVKEINS